MPQLGETVAEGKITKWFKAAGDAVKPGDNLFEIETDKTSMEVPSTTSGTLSEIRFKVGDVAKVGAVVAVISGAGEPKYRSGQPPHARDAESQPRTAPPRSRGRSDKCGRRRIQRRCRGRPRRWTHSTRCARLNETMDRQSLRAALRSRRWRDA